MIGEWSIFLLSMQDDMVNKEECLSFFVFLTRIVSLYPPTKIPVLNDQLVDF